MPLTSRLKESFVAGLILVAPLAITLYILRILVSFSLQFIDPLVAELGLVETAASGEIVAQALAVVLIVSVITVLGLLAQWSIGRHLFGNLGRTINIVPLVSTIYGGVRQVATSLVDTGSQFERTVLIEYPREDVYSIGFVTGEGTASFDEATGDRAHSVFLPNSPNPTAGRLVMVSESEIHETDMSVREGMRMIVTTGIGGEADQVDAYDDYAVPEPEGDD
ncbi:DUF502 domain-containing protein [Halosimplex pelagicum]|uniref:DUF502 domain-containing protein n=1 Tax=Halosimplex pelagicum TaxID=869886 RepID=A0A7D5TV50_9EURY|nr:DUF502 domain-containing protein [Halosimplex pelagicum]QLH82934.1 DUF502 domain-containing protein [Halosimplex pelagicum]